MTDSIKTKKEILHIWIQCLKFIGIFLIIFISSILLQRMNLSAETIENSEFQIRDGVLVKYTGTDTDVVIPEGVEIIDEKAFNDWRYRIISVKIPASVTEIYGAFAFCRQLETVEFSKESKLKKIGQGTFGYCENLKTINIPQGVTEIDDAAFAYCKSLEEVIIPNSVTSIGASAFEQCAMLTRVDIPDSVTSIGLFAFRGCGNLRIIIVPASVTDIGRNALGHSNETAIYGEEGSAAYAYAVENSHLFGVLEEGMQFISYDVGFGLQDKRNIACYKEPGFSFYDPFNVEVVIKNEKYKRIFEGWYTDEEYKNRITNIEKGTTGDLMLYSKWRTEVIPLQGTGIQYSLNGGINDSRNPDCYTEPGVILYNPIKEGYTFEGWYTGNNFDKKITCIDEVSENTVILQAKWTEQENPVKYNIQYVLNGGTNDSHNLTNYGDLGFVFYEPTRQGYVFDGWYLDTGFKTPITKIEKQHIGNLTLYAKWLKQCNITFNNNGGKNLSQKSIRVTENTTYGTLPIVTKKGYTFKGWYTQKNGGSKVTDNTTVTSDHTLYAQWKKVTKPSKVKISKAVLTGKKKAKLRQLKLKWKKVSGAKGYEILYHSGKGFKRAKKITTTSLSRTIKSLKKGKRYYVKIRAYKLDSAGRKVYGIYSSVKKVK